MQSFNFHTVYESVPLKIQTVVQLPFQVFSQVSPLIWVNTKLGQCDLSGLFVFPSPDRPVPCHIKFLRSQKVVYISCGDEHTAALTKVWMQLNLTQYSHVQNEFYHIWWHCGDSLFVTWACQRCTATLPAVNISNPDMWAQFVLEHNVSLVWLRFNCSAMLGISVSTNTKNTNKFFIISLEGWRLVYIWWWLLGSTWSWLHQ